ncbi:glycosyltransferase [Natrinema sp. 74]|uniref:glycosyltransferase n=1 Tax=Natrinema sp. 74 TaxID=3384159 RepID=UPI0038D4CCBD
MDVKTVEDSSVSAGMITLYASITLLLVAVVLSPTLVYRRFPRLLNTLLLLGLLGLVGRTLVSAVLSFRQPDTPSLSLTDDELPPVSVVIPAYNEEPVLPATIEACKNLDYPAEKLEVVLCYESASTDRTGEICRTAAADDPRFKAVERDEPGGGKAKATNYALRYASHDIISSIDADHCFDPGAIRRAVAWFESDDEIWCVKGRCYGDNPNDSLLALHATVERHIAEKADLFARHVAGGFTIFGGGQAFFRRDVFDELGEFDEEVLVEDIDMSSKIHAAGKRLVVDPSIITYEENPATLDAWWSQRKRWARGWMQVAVRYIARLPRNSAVSTRAKIDAAYTFAYAIIPVFVVVGIPLAALRFVSEIETAPYVPNAWLFWILLAIAPLSISGLVFLQDWRDGFSHAPREYLAAGTLWFYLSFQTAVFVTAFIEEFIVQKPSVYVTTSRSDAPSDD